ncbi:cellobiose phosphorylase [Babesia ovata]|uniref:Cellobiose phosphorylase n=1 Tax=Babesia ovata TaxID=189622 RepID=A0A2H6K9H7_9APIC|nr:cellobiose phosphorylase [Babesia ovata]GBE59641.1 cellobiose phosphorylase [Babesia ovata]
MGEGGCGRRIRDIVGWHVHRLHGRNGTLVGRRDTLLQRSKVSSKGRLVTDSRRNAPQKRAHFRTGLGETVNVVDEEQHILTVLVTEVLGHGQTSKGNTCPGTWRFVHLAVHQCGLGSGEVKSAVLQLAALDNAGLHHLVVKLITLPGAFSDTGKHGETTVLLGDVVNQFHNQHCFTDTGTTEQTDLTTLSVRSQQIDDLNTGDQKRFVGALVAERHGLAVNRQTLGVGDGSATVQGVTRDVHDTAQGGLADGHSDWTTTVYNFLPASETLRGAHCDRAGHAVAQVLRDLQTQTTLRGLHPQRVKDWRRRAIELDIHNSSDDLRDAAFLQQACRGRLRGEGAAAWRQRAAERAAYTSAE